MLNHEIRSETPENSSPRWNKTTKTIVVLALVALVVVMLFRFKFLIAPVLIAVLISYLFSPIATGLSNKLHISWRLAVTLLYLVFVAALIALITWGGITIVNEVQNLVKFVSNLVTDLPTIINNFFSQPLLVGPFTIDLPHLGLTGIVTYLQGMIQPVVTETATLIGSAAGGAASFITWIGFTILISYFISAETHGNGQKLISISIPGYDEDLRKMSIQFGYIWNSFLRGQLIVITITIAWYSLMLGSLGVNFFFGLAILAGLARFVPYIGPFVAWVTYFLVGLFQVHNIFGLPGFWFGVLLVGVGLASDFVIDNFVSPRVMSNALKIHPAAVLVTVLIGANLFGVIGMLLAAPVLATLQLVFTYVLRKLIDKDPWADLQTYPRPLPFKEEVAQRWANIKPRLIRFFNGLKSLYDGIRMKFFIRNSKSNNSTKEES
jgi:predicted PurR-regulated permease PerM